MLPVAAAKHFRELGRVGVVSQKWLLLNHLNDAVETTRPLRKNPFRERIFTTAFFTVPPGNPGERDQTEVAADVRHIENFNARGRMLL